MPISCIVPARNEAGHLRQVLSQIMQISEINEIVIVEGGSSDNTYMVALELMKENLEQIKVLKQTGKGKFNAVLIGSAECKNGLILIWDADGTVTLESTKRVISRALSTNGPVIGDRLKGNMERGSMRAANFVANWLFAVFWSPLLHGQVCDLLCGTKIFPKSTFEKIPELLKRSDPYGDFALLTTARLQKLWIENVPVSYMKRQYGTTNIKRWSGGLSLLRVSFQAYYLLLRQACKNELP